MNRAAICTGGAALLVAFALISGCASPHPAAAAHHAAAAHGVATSVAGVAPKAAACPTSAGVASAESTPAQQGTPVKAVMCFLPGGKQAKLALAAKLNGLEADVLWSVFTDAAETGVVPPGCTAARPDVIAIFAFAGGRSTTVPVVADGCSQPFAVVGARARLLSVAMGRTLFADAASDPTASTAVPGVVGDSLAEAIARARQAGYELISDGQQRVEDLPVGMVVAQSPMPGEGSTPGIRTTQLSVVTVVHAAPACRSDDLDLDYYGGGAGAGGDFGQIRIRNVGAAPCELFGPVGVVGIDESGRPDTTALTYRVAPDLVLSPHAVAMPPGSTPVLGVVTASVQLGANYRDDATSADGSCQQQVVPTQWRVHVAGGVTYTPNTSVDAGYPQFASLRTCRGQLDLPSVVTAD